MFNELKKLRLQAMKDKNTLERFALESVISSIDAQRGRIKDFEASDAVVIATIKKEIKSYSEMVGRDAEVEFLTSLLPKQLTNDELSLLIDKEFETGDKPKDIIDKLNKLGYEGRYDKGFVARVVMSKSK